MATTRPLAAAQTLPAPGDVDANLAEHLRLARAAAGEGAQVVVFPELSLTGCELERAQELAFAPDDARLAPLREVARAERMTLVVGAPLRLGERLHIGAFALSPDGGAAIYTKRHLGAFGPDANPGGALPPSEASVFAPGDHDPLVALDEHDAALAICADAGRPSHAAAAAARGAKVYLAGMFVVPAELERDAARLQAVAQRHAMAVVMANHGAPTGGLAAAGGSAVWSSEGALLAQLDSPGAGLALGVVGGASRRGWCVRVVRDP